MIEKWLKELEQEYKIDILYAVETGSRAWGGVTEHSDYDVRFIFKHRELRSYLSLQKAQETLEIKTPFDVQGWDLYKAFSLLHKSNPGILEWAFSPVVYNDSNGFSKRLRDIVIKSYSLFSLYQHYIHLMARNLKDIQGKDPSERNQKKLIQAMRAFLLAKTIVQEKRVPENALYSSFSSLFSDHISVFYNDLLAAKMAGRVVGKDPVNEIIKALENERNNLDILSVDLHHGKNIRSELDQWLWELLEI